MYIEEWEKPPTPSRLEQYRRWVDVALAVIAAAHALSLLYQAFETVWEAWAVARE